MLPGGIDVHTHMEMPFGGTFSVDTFETGTRAAAWGGTTTIIDFAVQAKGTSLLATLDKWHAKADGNCAIDYGFHMIVSDVNDTTLKEMDACIAAGVNSFKMFMAYPGVFYATDGEILLAMQQAARSGATVMMHAENGIAIDQLVAQALAAGRTEPVNHGLTRPPELEGEATSRAITLAQVADCPLYIVHLSARHALEAVAQARDAGQNVFAETCPQYLYLSLDDLARPDFEGAKFVASPPLRPKDHQDSLWRGLRTNDLSVVSTDHCPFCFKRRLDGARGGVVRARLCPAPRSRRPGAPGAGPWPARDPPAGARRGRDGQANQSSAVALRGRQHGHHGRGREPGGQEGRRPGECDHRGRSGRRRPPPCGWRQLRRDRGRSRDGRAGQQVSARRCLVRITPGSGPVPAAPGDPAGFMIC